MSQTAFPLSWPAGWPRTPANRRDPGRRFKGVTFISARSDLALEVERIGGERVILSTNCELRIDGLPYAEQRRIEDPGVALYFTRFDKPMAMARDAFDTVACNLRSLAMALEHLRGLERHGGALMVERAFQGFAALPEPGRVAPWRETLGFPPLTTPTEAMVEARYRDLARQRHPDVGGTDQQMAELNSARERAIAELAKAMTA